MNEIRKNNEQEIVHVKATFEMPKVYKIIYKVLIALFALISISLLIISINIEMEYCDVLSDYGYSFNIMNVLLSAIFPILCIIAIWLLYKRHCKAIIEGECVVTSKSIRGKTVGIFSKKNYNYRLDEIENIETISALGINGLLLHFSQGKANSATTLSYGKGQNTMIGSNIMRIYYLSNTQEMYDKLSNLLCQVKNDMDVAVDIEMKKVEAFSKIADGLSTNNSKVKENDKSDYITQIERLSALKAQGILTEEEFNTKKKELL